MDTNTQKPALPEIAALLEEYDKIVRLGQDCPPERREAFLARKRALLSRVEEHLLLPGERP